MTVERLSVTEYRWEIGLVTEAAHRTGLTASTIRGLLEVGSRRLQAELAVDTPIEIKGDNVRVMDVAGVVRLNPRLELEVAPKFLGAKWEDWREDFFVVAALSRFGRVLPREDIIAGTAARRDLATLLGHIVVREYWRNQRRPLRLYHHRTWQAFDIDGELDPEEAVLPQPGGFTQNAPIFDRDNGYMRTIHDAVGVLVPEVSSGLVRQQLERVHAATRPSPTARRPSVITHRLPSRHRRWQTLYDLSRDVLRGFGAGYVEADRLFAPGFVLKTNATWEDLIGQGLRSGFPGARVRPQKPYVLGTRNGHPVPVYPDFSVERLGLPRIIADPKYRTGQDEAVTVARGDLYEALAYAHAAQVDRIALVYPRSASTHRADVGTVTLADSYEITGKQVSALAVECRGLGAKSGFAAFAQRLAAGISVHGSIEHPPRPQMGHGGAVRR